MNCVFGMGGPLAPEAELLSRFEGREVAHHGDRLYRIRAEEAGDGVAVFGGEEDLLEGPLQGLRLVAHGLGLPAGLYHPTARSQVRGGQKGF